MPPLFPKLSRAVRWNLLSLAGGGIAALAFPNPWAIGLPGWNGLLGWVGLVPLLASPSSTGERGSSWRRGLFFGLVFFGINLWWMARMEAMGAMAPVAWALLTGYLSLYPACFLLFYHQMLRSGVPAWCAAPALWVGLEFLRHGLFSGFPWAFVGYSQYSLVWMRLLPVTGIWGVSAVTVLMNVGVVALLRRMRLLPPAGMQPVPRGSVETVRKILAGLLGLAVLVLGILEIRQWLEYPGGERIKVAALQGNVNQNQTWDRAYQQSTLARFRELLGRAGNEGARLAVWPETAFPGIFNAEKYLAGTVSEWSRILKISQLVGSDTAEAEKPGGEICYFNSVLLLDENGSLRGQTSKIHLVPFGEYVPYKDSWFFYINKVVQRYGGAGFTPGPRRWLLPWKIGADTVPIGALICFESIFSDYAADLCRHGSQLLVMVTYDTWFGETAAPAQHAVFSAFRAAETGRYLLRAAATGISCAFDPMGRCLGTVPLNRAGELTVEVRPRTARTFYVRWGNWFAWLCWAVVFLEFGVNRRRKKSG